jgi:hypothetical protein
MKNSVLKWEMLGIVAISLLGSFLHFAFDLSGEIKLIGTISAVNESVWEHLKIAFWPALLYAVFEYPFLKGRTNNYLIAKATSIYLMPITITAVFYLYTAAIGHHFLVIDIITFVAAIAVGQIASYRMLVTRRLPRWLNLVGLAALIALAIAFIVFTFSPPQLPIFRDSITGTYGIR